MAKVEIEIGANPKPFESALDSMRAKAGQFGEHLTGLGTKIAAGFVAARVFERAFDVLREGVQDIKDFKDRIEDVQASLGVAADEAQRFAYAVKRADADGGEMMKAMLKLRTEARAAAGGDAAAGDIFGNLGLDPQIFAAQSLADQVLTLADAFKELSRQGKASDVALQFLEAMGTKNRSVLKLLGADREGIAANFANAPLIGQGHLAAIDQAKEEAVAAEFAQRAHLADSGVMEGMGIWQRIGAGAKDKLMRATSAVGRQLPHFANFIRGNWGHEMEDLDEADRARLRQQFPGEAVDFPKRNAAAVAAAHSNPALTGTGTTAKSLLTPDQRAAMSEAQREMNFRNAQLLETDLGARADALKGEQRRLLLSATQESDPKKAFSLLMKGQGMEGEIMTAMRALSAPANLSVKATRVGEMGGGGPVAIFGGVELQIREQTGYLREIRDRLSGAGRDYIMSLGGKAPDGSQNAPGVFPLAHTVTKNFGPEGSWW